MIQPYMYLELNITDVGMEGEGIAHADDYTVFVPAAIAGETVKAQAVSVNHRKRLVFARLIKVIKASDDRVKPVCGAFGVCGGCDYMHADYAAELKFKRQNLAAILKKNAGLDTEISDVVPSDDPLGYRNKAQLVFGEKDGKIVLGFYRERTRTVKALADCPLHGAWMRPLISAVTDWANRNRLSAYSSDTRSGLLRHLVVRVLDGFASVTIVATSFSIPDAEGLVTALDKVFGERYSLGISENTSAGGKIMGEGYRYVLKRDSDIAVDGVRVEVGPHSFFQVNDHIRKRVYERLIGMVSPCDNTLFVDLYAGIGLTGIPIAKAGGRVINVEIVPEAVKDADKLYAANGMSDKVKNIAGDAADVLPQLIPEFSGRDVTVYLDPPRKGVSPELIKQLNGLTEDVNFKLIYLSCNPATLSRDLKLLEAFKVVPPVMPFDMFPRTANLETLVKLCRKPTLSPG